ncbi:MAG: class I SAM-dependent methyltransferase [Bryobacteraceae bacterium]
MKGEQKKQPNRKMLDWRCGLVEPYLDRNDTVLDIGAGTGWVAKRLSERKGCQITLVDVLDCNETELPLHIYDGETLPYASKTFDVALLVFVLHHTLNHEQMLREAARVARRAVIVVEDTPANPFERFVEWFWDSVLSIEHRFFAPHNYRRMSGWRELFRDLGLKLAREDRIKPFFPFYYTKAVFVLDTAAQRAKEKQAAATSRAF